MYFGGNSDNGESRDVVHQHNRLDGEGGGAVIDRVSGGSRCKALTASLVDLNFKAMGEKGVEGELLTHQKRLRDG